MTKHRRDAGAPRDVVALKDLAPQRDVKGGTGRYVFGGEPWADRPTFDAWSTEMSNFKIGDLQPKQETEAAVKGGGKGTVETIGPPKPDFVLPVPEKPTNAPKPSPYKP